MNKSTRSLISSEHQLSVLKKNYERTKAKLEINSFVCSFPTHPHMLFFFFLLKREEEREF